MEQEKAIRVLSVDDHAFLSEGLRARLTLEPDMEVVGYLSRADGLVAKVRETEANVVLLDIEMPGSDPFEALAELRRVCPNVRTIILSGHHPGAEHFWFAPGQGMGYGEAFVLVVRRLARAILNGEPAAPSFEDGLRCLEFIQAANQAAEGGGWVDLDHGDRP